MSGAEWVTVIGAIASLVTTIGIVAIRLLRELRSTQASVEAVARAAVKGPAAVAELVDDNERSGVFSRPTIYPKDDDG